jgi:hypothetical protein
MSDDPPACNKVAYLSRKEARTAANSIARYTVKPRPCRVCGYWHLTTQTSRGKRSAAPVRREKICLK